MITQPTVVVLGAGASNDLGLPLGPQLQQQVVSLVSDQSDEFHSYFRSGVVRLFGGDQSRANGVVRRAIDYARGLRHAASVDNFLDQVKSDVDFVAAAKMAVGWQIARAESQCTIAELHHDADILDAAVSAKYFLNEFLNLLVRGHQEDNIERSLENVTFVVFNYDRCLERILLAWFETRFPGKALALYRSVKILHVYGCLGPYDKHAGSEFFRGKTSNAMLNPHLTMPEFSGRIKVFTEQEDSDVAEKISHAIHFSRAILFLGFGFEEQNLRFFRAPQSYTKKIFATTMGKGKPNEAAIEQNLRDTMTVEGEVFTVSDKSIHLFWTYYHSVGRAVGSLPTT